MMTHRIGKNKNMKSEIMTAAVATTQAMTTRGTVGTPRNVEGRVAPLNKANLGLRSFGMIT